MKKKIEQMLNKLKTKIKRKMSKKIIIGKEYWVITTPAGKQSSNGTGTRPSDPKTKVKVINKGGGGANSYLTAATAGGAARAGCVELPCGSWYYDYELKSLTSNVESIDLEIKELKESISVAEAEIKELEERKQFMSEMKVDNFDDEQYKAYQVLKVLGIDDFEKAKQITKILSK